MPTGDSRKTQTTVRLPNPLYEEAKSVVERGVGDANTFNDLVVDALGMYLKLLKRKEVDRAFVGMGEDTDYQKDAGMLAAEFEHADWEALELAEKDAKS